MANKVSFIYIAQDRYSKIAEKINRVNNKMRGISDRAAKSIKRQGERLTELSKKAKGAATGLKNVGAKLSLFVTAPIVALGFSLKNAARDAEETASKFATVFKPIESKAQSVADSFAKNFGLAGSQARKLLGDTGDLLSGFGFLPDVAIDISQKVNELAVDLASFTNFSGGAEGASAALTKALLGERESIKSLGISILEEDVKKRVAILTAKGMRFETLRQAKAFATLQLAQEQSKNAIGDFARTSTSAANQERILSARLLTARENLGKILIPIYTKVVGIVVKLTDKFLALSPATKKWILIIGGVAAVLGPIALAFGGLLAMLPAIAAGFAVVATAVGAISLPVIAVGAAIAGVIAGLVLLHQNWDTVSNAIGGTIEQIMINFDLFANKISGIGGAVKGFFGLGGDSGKKSEALVGGSKSRTDVNVNLRAPQGAVESIKSKTSGRAPGLNVGVNMAAAG